MELTEVEAVYRRLAPILRARSARLLGGAAEAEDIAQETFVRFWSSGPRSESPEAVTAWIYRTSTRLAIDRLRRRKMAGPELDEPPGLGEGPSLEAAAHARNELERLARTVPEKELSVVVLARIDELSQQEVAEVLGISERTVRRLLSRFDARRSP